MSAHTPAPPSRAVLIDGNHLTAGSVTVSAASTAPRDLLTSFIALLREVRGAPDESYLSLRRADISALAGHLAASEQQVMTELAELIGATERQRDAMVEMPLTGANYIVVSTHNSADDTPTALDPGVATVNLIGGAARLADHS
jgi:hypothetical protein